MDGMDGAGPDLSVVVPVFNEAETLGSLVGRVATALDGAGVAWELVAVDDGSTDGSDRSLDELAAGEPRLRVVHLARNFGQSAALDAGFRHATAPVVGTLDADLQTFPEDLPPLLDLLLRDGVDAVVGIRADRRDPGWRRFTSLVANGLRNWLTRESIADTGCPLKVVRTGRLADLPRFDGMHRFLPTLLRLNGASVVQVPVRHAPRVHGRSKYGTWGRALRGLRDALGVRWLQDRRLPWELR